MDGRPEQQIPEETAEQTPMDQETGADAQDSHGVGSSDGTQESGAENRGFVFRDRRILASDEEELDTENMTSDKPTYVEQLEKRVEEAENRLAEYIQAYKQKTEVEWAELKGRLEKDMERQVGQARKQMVFDLLEVLDNLGRTTESARKAPDLTALIEGVEMVHRQFLSKLQALGLEPIVAAGQVFDPNLHEAAGIEEVEDAALDGRIVDVYQQGYSFGGTLLRPALVRVAKLRKS